MVGVVSFGFGCASPDTPGYYSNVYPQRAWINKVIKGSEKGKCPKQMLLREDSAAGAINYRYNQPSSSANKMLLLLLLYFTT